jgi:hydrogenase small subunit
MKNTSEREPSFSNLTRRQFLKASSAVATALGLKISGVLDPEDAKALESSAGGVPVVWLQAQACTGCSVSLLNSIRLMTIDQLLVNTLDVDFHPNIMAASGHLAVAAAEKAYRDGGYVLVVEGAIPTANNGTYCYLWDGLTALEGVKRYASRAAFIIGVGTCACYGGLPAGSPNPTGARGLDDYYNGKRVIKVPGCPVHPDWLVGTIAYLLTYGTAPSLDSYGRPLEYFSQYLHAQCPFRETDEASMLSQQGCLKELGCKGPISKCDCHHRKWNSAAANTDGVNWCCAAGAPCFGCTEPTFPDGMSPFYSFGGD